ncbi:uncharacterized protein FA14DRAFT_154599 [Meira miltonrushii]|uniref:Uncharacterized protein n=1 Tax=Meira miltonrushii TaxID=1280837 RepID=A0A316VCY6_9BASI|nr:uncharacterized protein FA14DRAFT_154599 [Meira miltonrushii]PWN35174.1 hypothetical protein FA14DRAFT_154599 [Meira miltonrushii]
MMRLSAFNTLKFLSFTMLVIHDNLKMLVILSYVLVFASFLQHYTAIAAPGAALSPSSSSVGMGSTSSFGGSDNIPGHHYPTRRPQQKSFIATKSKIWDRKEVEQQSTNNALRAHTAVLTTAGNAAAGVVKAGVKHLGNKMNVNATPEQKAYSRSVLRDARRNLVSAPKQVHKEASEMLESSRVRKHIAVHDYHQARKGANPSHLNPYTREENNKLASKYHKENKDFYAKVHAKNHDLSHPGTVQGHAVGYPIGVAKKV